MPTAPVPRPNLAECDTHEARRMALRHLLDRMSDDAEQRWPQNGGAKVRWLPLAQEIKVSLHTVQHWARRGIVPKDQAETLIFRYGRVLPKGLRSSHLTRDLDATQAV